MIEEIQKEEITELCHTIKNFCGEEKYKKCISLISKSMSKFPSSAVPHNLFGLVLEKMGDHVDAMKHFRAAIALEPQYRPANWNLQLFGTLYTDGKCAFDDNDIKTKSKKYSKNYFYGK